MTMFKAGVMCLLMVFPISVGAQTETSAKRTLQGKHRVELGVGLLGGLSSSNEVSVDGVSTISDADGLVGSIAYTYYFNRDFGFTVSAGLLSANATTSVSGSGATVESASVVLMLFGVKYQPPKLSLNNVLRPYASASIGPYFGSASNVQAGVTTSAESYSETALGSRLGIGMDLLLGKFITIGVGIGYHLVTDFENRIGSEKNYSGPEFALSFGVIFGG
jgi:outer membrane protein W